MIEISIKIKVPFSKCSCNPLEFSHCASIRLLKQIPAGFRQQSFHHSSAQLSVCMLTFFCPFSKSRLAVKHHPDAWQEAWEDSVRSLPQKQSEQTMNNYSYSTEFFHPKGDRGFKYLWFFCKNKTGNNTTSIASRWISLPLSLSLTMTNLPKW